MTPEQAFQYVTAEWPDVLLQIQRLPSGRYSVKASKVRKGFGYSESRTLEYAVWNSLANMRLTENIIRATKEQ